MGKATITSRNSGAKYDVTIRYGRSHITKNIAKIDKRQGEISGVDLPAAESTLSTAATAEEVARNIYDVAIAALAENPLQHGLEEVVEEKKKLWHGTLRPLHTARDTVSRIKSERLSLNKRKDWLNAQDKDDEAQTIWCADLSDGVTGRREITSAIDVGTIELFDRDDVLHTIIKPGYTADPMYSLADDGLISGVANNVSAGWFFNAAINPGWQQFKPKYRAGTIKAFNNSNHTATIALDEVVTTRSGKKAPPQTLTGVPTSYMDCNHWAFDLNDRVVVEFNNQKISEPTVIGFIDNPKYCDPGEFWCFPRSAECPSGWGAPFTTLPGICGAQSARRKFRRPTADWEQQTFDTVQVHGTVDWSNGDGISLSWTWSGKSRYEWAWSTSLNVYYGGAALATVPDSGYGVLGSCIKDIGGTDKLYIVGYNGLVLKVYQTDFDSPGTYITKLTLDLETLYQTYANGMIRATPVYFSASGSEAHFTFTPAYLITPQVIAGTDHEEGDPFILQASAGMGGCSVKLMKLSIDSAGDVTNTLITNTMPQVTVEDDYHSTSGEPGNSSQEFHIKTSASGQFIVAADYIGETVVFGYMNVNLLNEMYFNEVLTHADLPGCPIPGELNTTDYYEEFAQKVQVSFLFNTQEVELMNIDGGHTIHYQKEYRACSHLDIQEADESKNITWKPWAPDGDKIHRSFIGLDMRTGKYATITKHFMTNSAPSHLSMSGHGDHGYFTTPMPDEWSYAPAEWMELSETIEYMGVELWVSDVMKVDIAEHTLSHTIDGYLWNFGWLYVPNGIGSTLRTNQILNPMRQYLEWDQQHYGWLPRKYFGPVQLKHWIFWDETQQEFQDKIHTVHDTYDVLFPLDSNGLYGRLQEHDAWYLVSPFYSINQYKGFASSGSDAFLSVKTKEHETQIESAINYVNYLTHGNPNDVAGLTEGVNDTDAAFWPIVSAG